MISDIVYEAIEVEERRLKFEASKMKPQNSQWQKGYEAGITALRKAVRKLLLNPQDARHLEDGLHGY